MSLAPLSLLVLLGAGGPVGVAEPPGIELFFQVAQPDQDVAKPALARIAAAWRDDYAALMIDLARLMRPPQASPDLPAEAEPLVPGAGRDEGLDPDAAARRPGASRGFPSPSPRREHPSTPVRRRLIRFLEEQTGQRFGQDLQAWRRWYWARDYAPHPEYRLFKAALYRNLDPRMAEFFLSGGGEEIRLDEIDWGGVTVNGIPPLDHPALVPATEADYLEDDDVVFGIAVGDAARAYPKRILAWHELARDRLGGVELAIVYCTLCGTVIPYESTVGERSFTLGTSGLLYRSNKLMFDAETLSLWNTVEGRPVLGPLAGSGLELRARPVVTTTWRDWREAHPETTVLSLATGYERDYSEGAAYRDYFATDRLMFAVPQSDDRLDNKDEVLALLLRPRGAGPSAGRRALAIAVETLQQTAHRLFHVSFEGHDLVVVTSDAGAHRVYEAGSVRFAERLEGGARLRDALGHLWRVSEAALVSETGETPLPRVTARRAFWFGWFAQYPETALIR